MHVTITMNIKILVHVISMHVKYCMHIINILHIVNSMRVNISMHMINIVRLLVCKLLLLCIRCSYCA